MTLIKNGGVVDPVKGVIKRADLLIENGKITRILPHGQVKTDVSRLKVIDAAKKLIVPGLIDMHVHLREPGHEYKETVATGGKAGVVRRVHCPGLHAEYIAAK